MRGQWSLGMGRSTAARRFDTAGLRCRTLPRAGCSPHDSLTLFRVPCEQDYGIRADATVHISERLRGGGRLSSKKKQVAPASTDAATVGLPDSSPVCRIRHPSTCRPPLASVGALENQTLVVPARAVCRPASLSVASTTQEESVHAGIYGLALRVLSGICCDRDDAEGDADGSGNPPIVVSDTILSQQPASLLSEGAGLDPLMSPEELL